MIKIICTLTLIYVLTTSALPDPNQNYELPNFGPPQIRRSKPCNSNRKSSTGDPSELVPTYTAQVVKPLNNIYTNFKSESLQDENNYQKEVAVESPQSILTKHRYVENENQMLNNKDNDLTEDILLEENTKLNKEYSSAKVPKQTKSKQMLMDADSEKKDDELTQALNSKPSQINKVDKTESENSEMTDVEGRQAKDSDVFNGERKSMTLFKIREPQVKDIQNDNQNVQSFDKCIEMKDGFISATEQNSDEEESDEENSSDQPSRKLFENIRDPTVGVGVKAMGAAGVNLLQHSRVCYACSSISNPSCFRPDRSTTVKYCRAGQNACVTKRFEPLYGESLIVRDCAFSCSNDSDGPRPKSCKICHNDLCNDDFVNGAYSIRSQSLVISLFVVFIVKYSL